MRRAVVLGLSVLMVLVVAAPVSAATGISASRWRATLAGDSVHGGATTLIASDGRGTFSTKLNGLVGGSASTAVITASQCGTDIGDLAVLTMPAASSAGIASASEALSVAEAASFRSALSAHHPLSVRVIQNGAVVACGAEVGAPSVGTGRLQGTVAAVGATYDIRYPVVGGLDATVATAINTVLRHDADGAVAGFSADAKNAGKPMRDFSPSVATQTFSVSFSDGRFLSLGTLFAEFMTGAAHGTAGLSTYTFDLQTGARLRLADLFRPGSSYLALLSSESRTRLRALFHDPSLNEFINPGTTPSAGNFSAWQLVPSGLRITFQEYQVAPYAFGMPSIVIPWSTLRPVLSPSAP